MTLFMYYSSHGDGKYDIRLFSTHNLAKEFQAKRADPFGCIDSIEVDEDVKKPVIEELECPECSGSMVARTNRSNGEKFWGCKKFPECKGTRDSMGRSKAERLSGRVEDATGYPHAEGFSFNRAVANDKNRFRNEG